MCTKVASSLKHARIFHTDVDLEVPSNLSLDSASQPPRFRRHLQLQPHQLKSLFWMEAREAMNSSTEALRGGVLADKIGTGKTCVGLALIDKNRHLAAKKLLLAGGPSSSTALVSRATLVIVPPNICDQWAREVDKFLEPGSLRVFHAEDISDLKRWSFNDIALEADVIVASYRIFASKKYTPRRRQLEALRKQDLAEMGDTLFPVFEIFHFHRIIADEFHELVDAAELESAGYAHPFREAKNALCRIQSGCRWGITSTPPLKSIESVVFMASFFHVKLAPTHECVVEFVSDAVRRNSSEPPRVGLTQRKVLISQSVHERALYLLRRREGTSMKDLLSYASVQWSWSADHDDRSESKSAREVCKAKLQDLYRPIREKEEKLKEVVVKLKSEHGISSVHDILGSHMLRELENDEGCRKALQSLAHFVEDHRLEHQLLRARRAGEKKRQGSAVRVTPEDVRSLVRALGLDYRPVLFFESSLDDSDAGIECPICLSRHEREYCSIARCGHKACSACWANLMKVDGRCPICRDVVGDSLISLSSGDKLRPNGNRSDAQGSPFGSKVACLIDILGSILGQDGSAKVLVFCQFEELKSKIVTAFRELSVPHLKLDGSTADRAKTVRTFISPDGPPTLLLSMAVSPSGLDLSVANHVIIVQPTWHEGDDDKSVDFEAQSIGRCWRMGQERPVSVHRLCMASTVEENLVDRHMHLWDAKFGKQGS